MRVTVWNEHIHEREDDAVRAVYPRGIHEAVADAIRGHLGDAATVATATLDEPGHGLAELDATDVLVWWGHLGHELVPDGKAELVRQRVLGGMGFVVLHSGHLSKPFVRLMGTSCHLRWREADDRELVWTVSPSHPIVDGVPPVFSIPKQETYGEYFDIPQPDELVFISSFTGGEVFRSGCCFRRGRGRIFYFSPGHETYPVYRQAEVQRVIANAVLWASGSEQPPLYPEGSINSPTGWFE
ncbi:MAG: ThuA domain-containing protein [Verrucomicrobiota bacterium]